MNSLAEGVILQNGKYRICGVLGQGGFGITYLAIDLMLSRKVAIKEFFPKDYCDRDDVTNCVTAGTHNTEEFVSKLKMKFLKEAKNIAKFDHPYIIKIYSAFEENNTAYYVMELIEGESLSDIVRKNGPLDKSTALSYIAKVGEALEYVHSHRINHLDVKPANIIVRKSDDLPILIDFGLSKQYDSAGHQTSTTPTGISHGFAPIEQYRDGGVKYFSPQTDLYSLASTLYYLLTGIIPPQAPNLVDEDLTFPATIPSCFIGPISRGMSMKRSERQPTVACFITELNENSDADSEATIFPDFNDYKTSAAEDNESSLNREFKPGSVYDSNNNDVPISESERNLNTDSLKSPKRRKVWVWYVLMVLVLLGGGVIYGVFVHPKDNQVLAAVIEPGSDIIQSDGHINDHGYVDLGLPSGIKWATCNIGASSPSEYGDYFDWGDVTPNTSEYQDFCRTHAKEMPDISADSVYDAARFIWGGSWRMPTRAECQELVDKCKWIRSTYEGKNGYEVIGPNGKAIFLPAGGYNEYFPPSGIGESGSYWTSTPYEKNSIAAYSLSFYLKGETYGDDWYKIGLDGYRYLGRSIRPISD